MRLRRENGDFDFILTNGACTIPANLFPEQLLGQIVTANGRDHTIITFVQGSNGAATYTLVSGSGETLTYTVATGEVTTNAEDDEQQISGT